MTLKLKLPLKNLRLIWYDTPWKDGNAWFTAVSLTALSDHACHAYNFKN